MFRWLTTRRPVLLWRGLMAKRDEPNLERLAAMSDAERFVWAILPHAARSFAPSIVALPREKARAAAVAYLYCRMLDTYEDLCPDGPGRVDRLLGFGARLYETELEPPPTIADTLAVDQRDMLHLLLVSRCKAVDEVYRTLPSQYRAAISDLVHDMAEGMVWSSQTRARQGGLLVGRDQVLRYCHAVIGHPALFALRVLDEREPNPPEAADALRVSEMVQLANITRDIEKDLNRGVAYHADLGPFLNGRGGEVERAIVVRKVRQEFLALALSRAPSYVHLFETRKVRRSPAARAAAVMLLAFTQRHYAWCLRRAGYTWWRRSRSPIFTVLGAVPALVSARAARRIIRRVERRFIDAAGRLEATLAAADDGRSARESAPLDV